MKKTIPKRRLIGYLFLVVCMYLLFYVYVPNIRTQWFNNPEILDDQWYDDTPSYFRHS